jgi:hypothetical protein
MGLSLLNLGKKIWDIGAGVERQVNPFDHGATYSNPNPAQRPAPAPVPGRPAPAPTVIIRNGGGYAPINIHNPLYNGQQNNPLQPNKQFTPAETAVTSTAPAKPTRKAPYTPPQAPQSDWEKVAGTIIGGIGTGLVGFPKDVINTAITDPIREEAARRTHNQIALQNAEQAARNDNPFRGVATVGNDLAGALYWPTYEKKITQANENLGDTIAGAYGGDLNAVMAGQYIASANNQTDIERYLNQHGLSYDMTPGQTAVKIGSDVAAATEPLGFILPGKAGSTAKELEEGAAGSKLRVSMKPTADSTISQKEMQDIIDTHRKRFGDENVQVGDTGSKTSLGNYSYKRDMITLANDAPEALDTFNHESIHKAMGQFLSDKEIEQLYGDVVKLSGGKSALQKRYRANGYPTATWRDAAEEEIANRFIQYMKYGRVLVKNNKLDELAMWATKNHLPISVANTFIKLSNRIEKIFGRTAARDNLQSFYGKVDEGEFNGATRRAYPHSNENMNPVESIIRGHVLPDKSIDRPRIKFRKATTGVPEIDKAITNMGSHYDGTFQPAEPGIDGVIQTMHGMAAAGSQRAKELAKALKNGLTKEERHAVSDALEGIKSPDLTPLAAKVVKGLKGLADKGIDIRQAVDPKVNRVELYSPRILRSTLKNAIANAGLQGKGRLKSIFDLGDLSSPFSKSRQYGKFVDAKGNAVYGKATKLGLVHKGDGVFKDAKGNTYKQATVTTRELEQNLPLDYLHDTAPIQGLYHKDTARLQAKAAALQELNTNPTQHGLLTREQVASGQFGDNYKPVNVPGLVTADGEQYFANTKAAKLLERDGILGHPDARSLPGKVYDALTNIATQFIVINPLFHGANQLVQSAIASGNISGIGGGWARLMKGVATVTHDDIYAYLSQGGHIPSYGSDVQTALSRATAGVSKLSSKGMHAIELRLRVGLYKASIEGGMAPKEAIKNIDTFLGDTHQLSRAMQRTTLFGHYFKTMVGSVGKQVAHPIANLGATVNTAAVAGILAGLTYEYQKFTGNPDAYVRMPGEIGMIKEGVKAVGEIKDGEVPSIVTNRINPVAKEIGQQITDKDLFTGKPVTDTGRGQHVISTLFAPSQQASQVTSGKRSGAEVAENQLGLYTPHAKGYKAAENPKLDFLNKKFGGQVLDGNGEAAQKAYFENLRTAQKTLKGDTKTQAQFNDFLARSHDPKTGESIQNSPSQSIQNASALFDNDKLRQTVQAFEQSQPSHDPMWDLPDDQLKRFMQYKEQFTGDAAKTFLHDQANDGVNGNWIDGITAKSNEFYKNLPVAPGGKGFRASDRTPKYPEFDPYTQGIMAAYDQASPDEKANLMNQYSGELSAAFQKIGTYTNQMRKAEGAPEKNNFPEASPEVESIIKTYNSLPQHDGKKGGNASRFAWTQAHPEEYAKMQDYLTQATMYSLVNEAAKAQFKGATYSQKLLKDIKNAGQYDIATTTNADGTKGYEINPALAYAQGGSGSSAVTSGYRYKSSYDPVREANYKDARYLSNSEKLRIRAPKGKVKKAKIISGGKPGSGKPKFKVAKTKPTKSKVALKKSKV